MITPSGLIELDSGWYLGVRAVGKGQIRMVLEFDPCDRGPIASGVKDLRLSVDEAREVEQALRRACSQAGERS